ncbi:MAG: hypothetical protein ACKVII_22555 [Planctomycetales bacterium]|jgi:hypothetical protein
MTQLQNVSSVLEVAFAVNGLHYVYATRPKHESHLQEQLHEIERLTDKCAADDIPVPPLTGDATREWGFQFVARYKRGFWANATICAGLAALVVLTSSAYHPKLEVSAWVSVPFLLFLFVAPLRAYATCREIELAIEFYVEHLENLIRMPTGQDIPVYVNPLIPIGVRSHSIEAYRDALSRSGGEDAAASVECRDASNSTSGPATGK